jgi:hypothetical protein
MLCGLEQRVCTPSGIRVVGGMRKMSDLSIGYRGKVLT